MIDTCPNGKELTQKNPLVCEKCEKQLNEYKETGVDKKCTPCPDNHITLTDGAASRRECVRKLFIVDYIKQFVWINVKIDFEKQNVLCCR